MKQALRKDMTFGILHVNPHMGAYIYAYIYMYICIYA